MSATKPALEHLEIELPAITRRDRARFVKEARRLRAEEAAKLFRAIGRGLARLGRALTTTSASHRPAAQQRGVGQA
jgi:hypothetical protein